MQQLNAAPLNGTAPIQYPIIQSQAANRWIDVNNESPVTLSMSLGGRPYLIPPNSTVRYQMDGTETFVTFTPTTAANPATDTVSGMIYNVQDSVPVEVERGANAADILPITSAQIADGAVIASKVAADAINTINIVNGAVAAAKVASGAIGTSNIQTGAVTNTLIGASAVDASKIAALAVATAAIQNAAISTSKIADGAVSTIKIANLAVTNALIANAAVGTAQIATAAITTALIQTAAITDALIANVAASKITAGTITATITIVGPVIKTANTGRRIEIASTTLTDTISFYSGLAGETVEGVVQVTSLDGTHGDLILKPPNTGSGVPNIDLRSDQTIRLVGTLMGSLQVAQASAQLGVTAYAAGGWTGLGPTALFTKLNTGSNLLVMFTFSLYTTAAGSFSFGIAADPGNVTPGTIRSTQGGFMNALNTHTPVNGFHKFTGIVAGQVSVRCAINPSVAGFNSNADDYCSLAIIEC